MPLLAAVNIRHAFGTSIVLDGCSISVEPGQRIGVVGRNGCGKTTLLKAMAGLLKPDAGEVTTARGCRVGYLHQDPVLDPDETLRGAAEAAFAELHRLHAQLGSVFHEMSGATGDALQKLLKTQERLEQQIEAAGGYAIDHRIDSVLHGLGFTDGQFTLPVSKLSGGQKGRLALARLLLEEPDVLLLDEPTNHLDIDGRLWLEKFLKEEFHGAVVMISHDRYLLDNVVTRIIEVEHGRLIDYPGNYAAFREIRAQRRLTQLRAYEKQQDRFRSEEEYIRRYKAGQRAKQAQGRLSRLEREKSESALERPMELDTLRLELPKAERTGDIVISARGISKAYALADGSIRKLFSDLDIVIGRGERWGIIGPNGAGKTTLVRCLLGEVPVDQGVVRPGSNLKIGYYRQSHDHLRADLPVYRYLQKIIQDDFPGKAFSEQQARNLAGAFLFSGDEQEAELGRLSGGERSRAVLAGLLASGKNLLVLDEPTNHLDIPSAERLEQALALPRESTSESAASAGGMYEHTLIVISHDRAFIDATCDHLVVLDGRGGAEVFTGNYTQWHERDTARRAEREQAAASERRAREEQEKKRRAAEEAEQKRRAAQRDGSKNPLERLKTEQIEKRIEETQARISAIDLELGKPEVWKNPAKCSELGEERSRLVSELEPLEFEWMRRAETAS